MNGYLKERLARIRAEAEELQRKAEELRKEVQRQPVRSGTR